MKEFIKLLMTGVISGLIVLFFGWYMSDLRDNLRIGLRVDELEKNQDKIFNQLDSMGEKINRLNDEFSRIDERTKVAQYNSDYFNQVIKSKDIPQTKADAAKQYLNMMPNTKDAVDYLKMNLGFSPDEAKAVVFQPLMQKNKIKK
jgi:hypothetical protein